MRKIASLCVVALWFAVSAFAQQASTGSIAGTVTDPSGQVVPAASVRLTFELNGEQRNTATNETGDFFFGALAPGAYTVHVDAKGFRTLEQKGNILAASARLALS